MSMIGSRRALLAGNTRPVYFENFLAETTLSPNLSFSRASGATMFDSTGTLVSVGNDVPRFDHDAAGNSLGLLIESGSINCIPNNSATGGGTNKPLDWDIRNSGPGITETWVGVGTEYGIPYQELQISGTPTGSQGLILAFNDSLVATASQGQTWTCSLYLRLVSGSLSNISAISFYVEEDPFSTGSGHFSSSFTPTGAPLNTQLFSYTVTLANPGTTSIFFAFSPRVPSGVPINATFRIGAPQLEQSSFATSPVLTATNVVNRAADAASFVNEPSGPLIVEWTDEATGIANRTLFTTGTFGPMFPTARRYRQIAAYKAGTSTAYLNTKLTAGTPL